MCTMFYIKSCVVNFLEFVTQYTSNLFASFSRTENEIRREKHSTKLVQIDYCFCFIWLLFVLFFHVFCEKRTYPIYYITFQKTEPRHDTRE